MGISSTSTVAEIIGNALIFNPKRRNTLRSQLGVNQLQEDIECLFIELDRNGILYLLIGGMAMLIYVDGRNTDDLDLLMPRPDINKLKRMRIVEDDRDFVRGNYGELPLDLVFTENDLFEMVRQNYRTEVRWGNFPVWCATPLGLVILKLYALPSLYQWGKFNHAALQETDILQLIYNYDLQLESAMPKARFAPEVVKDYLSVSDRSKILLIVDDIHNRRERMILAKIRSLKNSAQGASRSCRIISTLELITEPHFVTREFPGDKREFFSWL